MITRNIKLIPHEFNYSGTGTYHLTPCLRVKNKA